MVLVRQMLVASKNYKLKCPNTLVPEGFCVHNTYNNASANNEVQYMINSTSSTSYHYAVDDKEVVQGIPLDRNAWHAGDGNNGPGNRKYIGIEICYSKDGGERYTKAEENAVQFIAQELKSRGWGIERVKKHQDFSGKYCPHRILDEGRWTSFLARIEAAMRQEVKEVKPVYTDRVKVPNTALWQARNLVQEYSARGYKCYAEPLKVYDGEKPLDTDGFPFVLEVSFKQAHALKIELDSKGYAAVWEAI